MSVFVIVILCRQLQRMQQVFADRVLMNVAVVNGLECKIDMKTCKLFFVEHSEDFMYRQRTCLSLHLLPFFVRPAANNFRWRG